MKQNFDVFAARLRELRWEKDWRQGDLAEESGLSQARISRYERGEQTPTADSLIKLSRALDCTVDYLVWQEAPRKRMTDEEVRRWELVEACLEMQESEAFLLQLLMLVAMKLLHTPASATRKGTLRLVQALVSEEMES